MCGITGIVYLDKERNVDSAILKNMADSIFHRGPDDEGYYLNNNVGLGFRRLSIIDLSTGHQPLSNEDQSVWIVFNGEIYNYKELQADLIRQGHIFRTKSDTETIVHLYEQYGIDCLEKLRGMFAFAIWDNNKQQLFCARDRFGIKPFYYYKDNEKFVFGSEIKAILKAGDIDNSLSGAAIDSYFAFGYITSDLSIYKRIKKLNPCHYLLLKPSDNREMKTGKYWEIHFEPDYSLSEKQWEEAIQSCLSDTVRNHMISDVPLGAFLSGGVDSGSVVAMMAKNSKTPIKTFSIGFKEEQYNELKYAREVAKKYGCEHYEQVVEPGSMNLLPELVKAYDEPFADSSAIPTYYVAKLARQFVTVALSGDGGDELFAGYNTYRHHRKIHDFPFNFNNVFYNKLIWGSIHRIIPSRIKGKGFAYYLSKNKEHSFAYLSIWTEVERKKLLLHNNTRDNSDQASELYKVGLLRNGNTGGDYISDMQYLDLRTYLVDDILTKVDRASMINSLEVRVPLLDHKFAELTFRIPRKFKMNGSYQKLIFKKAMSSYIPESILNLPKKGFGMPIASWFKEELNEYVNDTLLSGTPLFSEYLDQRFVHRVISRNRKSMRDMSSKIWTLLIFEEWLKQKAG
jgi:asparagine synthase (glutamine-hydrolysing)